MNPPDYTHRLLTAGHCVYDTTTMWRSQTAARVDRGIGYRHSWSYGYGGDAGTIKITEYFYGLGISGEPCCQYPVPKVVVDASPQTTANNMYQINDEAASFVGLFVCMTSGPVLPSGDYTQCGTVDQVGTPLTHTNGVYIGPTNRVCGLPSAIVQGASGGPWYKNGYAYGITSAALTINGSNCGWYVDATLAEQQMGVYIIHAYI